MGWKPILDVEIQPLSLSMAWSQLRFPSPPQTNNITSRLFVFKHDVLKEKQTNNITSHRNISIPFLFV